MRATAGLSCPHERDVLDLVAIDQWPARADDALRAHVAGCPLCAEVAAVAPAVRDWADEPGPVRVPDASVVWYRAQVRAREEAARRASRPVLAAQLVAVVTVVVAGVWISPGISASWQAVGGWWAGLPALPSIREVGLGSLVRFAWVGWTALAALGLWAIVGSLAYLLTADD